MTDRTQYTEGLRQIADFLDAHPEVPLPYQASSLTGIYEQAMIIHLIESEDQKQIVADVARAMGRAGKNVRDDRFALYRRFAGIALVVNADREQVCERVVIGTRQVEISEPDPEALAAVPKVTRIEVVEDVEWRCQPILAATEEKAPVSA